MNLRTIYSTSPARGWLPWALFAPVLCIALAIATEIPSTLFLERFGFVDAQGEFVGAQGLTAMLVVSFITWLLAVAAWIAVVERRNAGTIGLTRAGAAQGFYGGLVVGVVMPSAMIACIWLAGAYERDALFPAAQSSGAIIAMAGLFVGFLVQASIEEIIFRGWLISVITRRANLVVAVLLSSLTFTLLHFSRGQPWLVTGNILLFALFASAWSISSNNIWGVMGWHVGWNWIIATGFDVPVTGLDAGVPALIVSLAPAGTDFLTGGADGPEGSIFCTLFLVCGIIFFMWRIARKGRGVGPDHNKPAGAQI
ncbi:membrane protease YdiL (CAAX protease family) [Brevundimonas vesicularis]|uniref:CPBP family intramembrane glutamic endopeptidase n=1 Tax=Brevundimonas vesicularis TaxID=41276 RepID=UPI002787F4B3|nr:type II CAAX endopeptidase family protein [Brevundimonas vesicularis]MDQ1191881.1 membrane protease YdiL (CAAX protease family) [Brevundimonas vesicularis]